MLTQTEVRPAAADVFGNWQTAASVQEPSPRVTAEEFREALSRVASSVSIVSTDGAHGIAGFTCSAVCSVTDEPPTIMVCVNRKSAANAIIKANGVLCVSSLGAEQIERFAGPHWSVLATGSPYCTQSRVALDCRVADIREVGTHSVIFAEVLSTFHATDGQPLIYHSRNYATIRHVA